MYERSGACGGGGGCGLVVVVVGVGSRRLLQIEKADCNFDDSFLTLAFERHFNRNLYKIIHRNRWIESGWIV